MPNHHTSTWLVEIRRISWNPWNPADFTLKSGGFHEIRRISWNPWNPADFTREIRRISPRYHLSNPSKIIKASVSAKTLQFWWMQGGGYDQGFHEIHPEIWWISPMKSGGFHPDFTCEIHPNYKSKCFSKNSSVWWMQGGGFHPWNPVDFTLKSGGFHPWNLVDFTQISPVKSIQNYKSKCFSKNSSVLMNAGWGLWPRISWNSPWNPVDFTHEIWQISPRFHLWNPPKL